MEVFPMLLDWEDQHSKMTILPKAVYRFNEIPIKIPRKFFTDIERTTINLYGKNKKLRIAKTILYKKVLPEALPSLTSNTIMQL